MRIGPQTLTVLADCVGRELLIIAHGLRITAPLDEAKTLTRELAKALASLTPSAAWAAAEPGRMRVPAARAGDKPVPDARAFIRSRIKEKGLSLTKEQRP